MKKELEKGNRKLTLGKMTVAKLEMSRQQMQFVNGGNNTKPIIRPASKNDNDINCATANHTGTRPLG